MENKFVSEIPKRFKEEYFEEEEVKLEIKYEVHTECPPIDVNSQPKEEIKFHNGFDSTSDNESKPFKEDKVDSSAKAFQCFQCSKLLANQNSLSYHLKNHENIYNFVC